MNWESARNNYSGRDFTAPRPPLGLEPQKMFQERMNDQRRMAILDAMERYTAASMVIPQSWIDELRELTAK